MDLTEFRFFDKELQPVHFVDPSNANLDWIIGDELLLAKDGDLLVVGQGTNIAVCRPKSAKTLGLASSGTSIWRLATKTVDHMQLEHCGVQKVFSLNLDIKVDNLITNQLSEKDLIPENTIHAAMSWLTDEFLLIRNDQTWLTARFYKSNKGKDLQLLGRRYMLAVANENARWIAKSFTKLRFDRRELIAISGDTRFSDGTVQAQITEAADDIISQHINDTGSYLELWQLYSELQWKIATRAARKLGFLKYEKAEHMGRENPVYRFNVGLEQANDFLRKLNALQDEDELPVNELIFEVAGTVPTWLDENVLRSPNEARGERPLLARNIEISPPYIELEVKQKHPPKKGFVFLSLQGDKSAHERRERAYLAIQMYQNPMPQLRMLLEGINPPIERSRGLEALSNTARKRFKAPPTERQKEALDVALNTPDLALIIGPPGTGKTQVISALQQRIVDDYSSGYTLKHQILLTSFQHDAVDNVVDRSGVFGLPAMKVGGRRFGNDGTEDSLGKWRISQLTKLKPQLETELKAWPVFMLYEKLKGATLDLRLSRLPGARSSSALEVDELIKQLANEHRLYLNTELTDKWQKAFEQLLEGCAIALSTSQRSKLMKKIRGLRTEFSSFKDDGVMRLSELIQIVADIPRLANHQLLKDLIQIKEQIELNHELSDMALKTLSVIKADLLDLTRPDYRPAQLRNFMDKSTCDLIDNIEKEFYELLAKSRSLGPLLVRHEYLKILEDRPDQVEKSIKDYVTILGATCQQAAGDRMLSVKDTSERLGIDFDTVIVDEAARANPLDLMIPMAMAKRRITLVGDHLQLPHMLEPRVEYELQDIHELDSVKSELLRISLFEHLHRQLLQIQRDGGPKRVVMLDTQFRMHPELGKFVSQEFYERRGFDPIKSGLSEDHFNHTINGFENCVAAWIDVSKDEGMEKSRNGSKFRAAEAKRCAIEAAEILRGQPDLSVGIITFYGAQRDTIYAELAKLGFVENSDKGWQIKPEYRLTDSGEERLRVGSVDAFQGKEFDVVILSIVRTWNPSTELTTEALNRKLGFLRLPNRINVGMSRQKKLLIVVGDKELSQVNGTQPDSDLPLLPGFPAFYEFCRGPYGKLL